jgi:hypothetical protein
MGNGVSEGMSVRENLKKRVMTLSQRAWEIQLDWPEIETWLSNFSGQFASAEEEKLHALYLLTQSMYFGQNLIREMLRTVYAQLFRYPIISKIRSENSDTFDQDLIENAFSKELHATRFLGVGNPSESGPHLLYYFRQVSGLKKDLFMESAEILSISRDEKDNIQVSLADPDITRYVFVDDLLGSGTQISTYLKPLIRELRSAKPDVKLSYFALFATSNGLTAANVPELFDGNVRCVFELDDSFKCFHENARCFANVVDGVTQGVARAIAEGYGRKLVPQHPLGYKSGELLLALFHNTPDNSLPIIWFDDPAESAWAPIFPRYQKAY